MPLTLGNRHAEAERAYQWLVDLQRPDGSWHQYYLADRVEQDKLDANVIAYVAAGVWHRWLCTGDRGFAETMWPVVERAAAFVMDGCGVRCVSDRPWVTAAETCEYAMANLAVGNDETARRLFAWAQRYRTVDGRYWTGTVFPDEGRFPAGERSTYTASAVVLAADGLAGGSPASCLFTRPDEVLPEVFDADADEPVNERD